MDTARPNADEWQKGSDVADAEIMSDGNSSSYSDADTNNLGDVRDEALTHASDNNDSGGQQTQKR